MDLGGDIGDGLWFFLQIVVPFVTFVGWLIWYHRRDRR